MINFIKRNAKTVIISAVSISLIVVLATALIITNVGTGSARGRDRGSDRVRERAARHELTEEQLAEYLEQKKEQLLDRLEQRFENGAISQEEYEEKLAAIENGVFPLRTRGGEGRGNRSGRCLDKPDIDENPGDNG